MSYPQYGVYLIPPPPLLYQVGLAHQLLQANFNAHVAGKFMVHCTIKGFFKLAEGAAPADFIPALDELFARTAPIETEFKELWKINDRKFRGSILLGMERTEALHRLHNEVWDVVRPYIAPDCLFSPVEPAGPSFPPHVTMAMHYDQADPCLFDQAASLCEYIFERHLRGRFVATDMQLIEFYSDSWAGEWGDTLRYKQLKGWRLAEPR